MKKAWKRIVIIALALVLLAAAAALAYAFPMFSMSPTPTGGVPDTYVFALDNGMNSLYFLPDGDDGYLLIDAGADADGVARALPEIGVDPLAVGFVLLTHTDRDHVAALELFPNAQICMGKDELQMVNGTTRRNAFSRNALPDGVQVENMVADGHQLVTGGHVVECIESPGHTPGSMSYLVDGQYLFTGDAFRVEAGVLSTHPYTMDSALAAQTIQALSRRIRQEELLVFTAHYGCFPPAELLPAS